MIEHGTARLGATFIMTLSLLAVAAGTVAAADPVAAQDARDHCTAVGGEVQERGAFWGTNADPSQWVDLGRSIELCRFQADDEAQSRIYVDILTLASEQPSLAAGAYLSGVPMDEDVSAGNPATSHCASLGGSSQWGADAAGGGWVAMDDPDDVVVAMCVFPDGSMIDEWGIAYMSAGEVRGADLSTLLRSAEEPYPPFFGG
jgi:putative hemolysin